MAVLIPPAGMWIGLTPIVNFGKEWMKKDILPAVLRGDKYICLAISEAFAGSDVAGIQTTAVKSDCVSFPILDLRMVLILDQG